MKKKILLCLAVVLISCLTAAAQDAKMQPLTFWYEYTINPGKEAQFLDLVKTVGAPVRDKLMAEGVVLAWGVHAPLLRIPASPPIRFGTPWPTGVASRKWTPRCARRSPNWMKR